MMKNENDIQRIAIEHEEGGKKLEKSKTKYNPGILKIGACVSIVQSGLFEIIALSALGLGIDQFIEGGFGSLNLQSHGLFLLLCFAFVVIAILGIAITPAEKEVIEEYHEGLATLGSNFAYIGHAGTIIFFSWWIFLVSGYGEAQAVIQMADVMMSIKWGVMFELVFVGAWVWIIAYIIFRYRTDQMLKNRFGGISIAKAISFWFTFVAFYLNDKVLCVIGLTLTAVIFGPLWHAWIAGIFFRFAKHPRLIKSIVNEN